MNKQQKEQVVSTLRASLAGAQASFLVGYKGLTVNDLQELRKKLRAEGGTLQVAKARLIKRAVTELPVQEFAPLCKDQIALVYTKKEAAPIAKVVVEFGKDRKVAPVIISGYAEQRLLDAKTISFLATLPSRQVLLAQLCGLLQAPVAQLARTLQAVADKTPSTTES